MSARKRREGIDQDIFDLPIAPLSEADVALFGEIQKVDQQLATVGVDGTIRLGSFSLTSTGLLADEAVTFENWREVGKLLHRLEGALQWLIGDWLALGERTWGDTYQQVVEETGYDYQTLRDYAWVASNVELSIRIDKLSFSHHRLVAGLSQDEQVYWLQGAADGGWTISQMRRAIQGDPPTLSSDMDRFAHFLAQNRKKYSGFAKKFRRVGQGEKNQISQMLDDEIARLQAIRDGLWEE